MKISVLGAGAMGSALATCLIEAGHTVTVWNRTPEKLAPLTEMGAIAAADARAALEASPVSIVCIKGHKETLELVETSGADLTGRVICEMSTGVTEDAERLMAALEARGARWLLGMINAYPSGIGEPDAAILTVGDPEVWASHGDVIRTLGGAAAHVGETPAMLAALFAGLFTVRQGFMFGMIYGALACERAGVSMQVFVDQMPASLKLVQDYYDVFSRTVPAGNYANPEASLKVYAMALDDALQTVQGLGAPDDLLRLMHDRTRAAWDAGYGEQQLTALVEHLGQAERDR